MPGSELFGAEERKEVNDVMESGMLFRYNHDNQRNGHWKSREFESEFADHHGVPHAHMVTSGSTAVATAMASVGIGYGDEVIVPPFTYIATVEGALLAGAKPVFAEIDDTLCLSPEGIKAAITEDTKAVILVHMCGAMAKLDEIIQICEENNIILLEDTAQALGGSYKGKALGTYGKVGAFSFDFFKIITAGEGGAIITSDPAVYDRAHQFSDHGHDHIGDNRGAEGHPILGFNFRTSELHAAVGLAQLRKLPQILDANRANKKAMKDTLAQFEQVTFRHLPDADGDSATFLSFFMPDEASTRAVAAAMNEEGVGEYSGVQYWYDNNYHYIKNWNHMKAFDVAAKLPVQGNADLQDWDSLVLPASDDIVSRLISLVVKIKLTDAQLKELCDRMERAVKKVVG